jgi:hypothetical protein
MRRLIFLSWLHVVFALPTLFNAQQTMLEKPGLESSIEGWLDPRHNGGRFLDVRVHYFVLPAVLADLNTKYTTSKLGEPLNVIISSLSDPFILTETGFHYYAK